MGGELGAVLGQYNLNIIKFCNEFNNISHVYENSLPLKLNLLVLNGNEFHIKILGPTLAFFLKKLEQKSIIQLIDIVKIAIFKNKTGDIASVLSICKNIICYIKNSKVYKVKYE